MLRRRFLKLLAALPLARLFGWQVSEEDGLEITPRDGHCAWEEYVKEAEVRTINGHPVHAAGDGDPVYFGIKVSENGCTRIQDDAKWGINAEMRLYASHDDGETWIPMMTPNDWEV